MQSQKNKARLKLSFNVENVNLIRSLKSMSGPWYPKLENNATF